MYFYYIIKVFLSLHKIHDTPFSGRTQIENPGETPCALSAKLLLQLPRGGDNAEAIATIAKRRAEPPNSASI